MLSGYELSAEVRVNHGSDYGEYDFYENQRYEDEDISSLV